jgi:hypothetical protein
MTFTVSRDYTCMPLEYSDEGTVAPTTSCIVHLAPHQSKCNTAIPASVVLVLRVHSVMGDPQAHPSSSDSRRWVIDVNPLIVT